MITLTPQEITELQNYLLEIPAKYSLSVINFINVKIQQQNLLQEANKNVEEEQKGKPEKKIKKADA